MQTYLNMISVSVVGGLLLYTLCIHYELLKTQNRFTQLSKCVEWCVNELTELKNQEQEKQEEPIKPRRSSMWENC